MSSCPRLESDFRIESVADVKGLSKRLTAAYGKGFTKSYLYSFATFYKNNPGKIFQTVFGKYRHLLSWSHYFTLNQELNNNARTWYEEESRTQNWSVRTLQRNISSQYYHRIVASQRKDLVEKEMLELTAPLQDPDPTEFIKNPVIGEFLGFTADSSFRETELEQAIVWTAPDARAVRPYCSCKMLLNAHRGSYLTRAGTHPEDAYYIESRLQRLEPAFTLI